MARCGSSKCASTVPGAAPGLHAYQGDLLDQIIRGNVVGTSTVVYDLQQFPDKRFKVEFTNAGEDYLFWMDIAHSGAKVAFSSSSEANYGRGVNIFAGTGWGTEKYMLRLHNEIKYQKLTRQLFPVTPQQRAHIQASLGTLRNAFARDLLHRVAHRKPLQWGLLWRHVQLDPQSFLLMPFSLAGGLLQRGKS